jgi:hypothetical protein
LVPYFLVNFYSENKFTYLYNLPKIDEDNTAPSVLKLGCITNKNYFNINHIRLIIESDEKQIHDSFWEAIGTKLSNL